MKNKSTFPVDVRDLLFILIGSIIQAIGLHVFLVPARLASGGVTGISILINHYTNWPIGLMVLVGNIPLLILGWRFLGGKRFAIKTAAAVIIYSLTVDLLAFYFPTSGITDDIVLNSLYGAGKNVWLICPNFF